MPSCPIPAGPRRRSERRASSVAQALLALALVVGIASPARAAVALDKLRLPPGFRIELVTDAVPNARQMALGRSADGRSTSTSAAAARARSTPFADRGRARRRRCAPSRAACEMPSGVAWRDGASTSPRSRGSCASTASTTGSPSRRRRWSSATSFPARRHHGRKFIAFGPDGKLYVPVGAPCNVCEPSERHGVIQRMKPDGSGLETVARGVRNSRRLRLEPGRQARSGSPTTAATCSATTCPPTSSIASRAPASTSASRTATRATPPTRSSARKRPCSEFVAAGGEARRARRRARHALLYRQPVPAGLSRQRLHRRARLVEPQQQDRLPGRPGGGRRPGPRRQARAFVEGWLQGRNRPGAGPPTCWSLPDGSLLVSDDQAGAIYRIRYAP